MLEQEAKRLVVLAGKELVSSGLIARTWGNVSCRVDQHTFAVTPSGRAYETLTEEEIVICKVEDATYEGDVKPSSEKGIHALLYRSNPDIKFVIHTHQTYASAVSTFDINDMPVAEYPLLGSYVPIAKYGLPGTKPLKKNIGIALTGLPGHAIIMAHHGALMFGSSYEETFEAAKQLEAACLDFIQKKYLALSEASSYEEEAFYQHYLSKSIPNAEKLSKGTFSEGYSIRTTDGLIFYGDSEIKYLPSDSNLPKEILIHFEIFRQRKDINYILSTNDLCLSAAAGAKNTLRPLLDDFAQIVGLSSKCSKSSSPAVIVRTLHGRLGVLVPRHGALCCAATLSDAQAVAMVMKKNAFAQISSQLFGGAKPLSLLDCKLMHFVYTKSYSKKSK